MEEREREEEMHVSEWGSIGLASALWILHRPSSYTSYTYKTTDIINIAIK